jgi:hypothetical protein
MELNEKEKNGEQELVSQKVNDCLEDGISTSLQGNLDRHPLFEMKTMLTV